MAMGIAKKYFPDLIKVSMIIHFEVKKLKDT
jgi:hypothetical protein